MRHSPHNRYNRKYPDHWEAFFADTSLTNAEVATLTGLSRDQVGCARYGRGIRNYPREERLYFRPKPGGNPGQRYRHWTHSAIFCKTSGAACHLCPNHKYYGMHRMTGCSMPEAIKELEKAKIPLTEDMVKRAI